MRVAALQDVQADKKVWIGLTVGVLTSFVVTCSSLYSAVVFTNELQCAGAPPTMSSTYLDLAILCIIGCTLSSAAHYQAVKQDSVRWSTTSQLLEDVSSLFSLAINQLPLSVGSPPLPV